MTKGVGIDICRISRIRSAAAREGFLERYFTPGELAYCGSRGRGRMRSLAGLFAAKEAVVKALGTGFRGIGPGSIEIGHDALGTPVLLPGAALETLLRERGIRTVLLSISHDGDTAVAIAWAEAAGEEII